MLYLLGFFRFKWTYLVAGILFLAVGTGTYATAHPTQPVEIDGTESSYVELTKNNSYDHNESTRDLEVREASEDTDWMLASQEHLYVRKRAETLATAFGPRVKVHDWDQRSQRSKDACVLVNTTSLGLKNKGHVGIDFTGFNPATVVSDIVYVPLETAFLRAARLHGLATVDGLGMLLHQAVPGFERWFGIKPVVTPELTALIEADIAGARPVPSQGSV